MKTLINGKEHEIIYIEYSRSVPFNVITIEKETGCKHNWDFFENNGNKDDLLAYNSGFGGDVKKVAAPQWADGYTGKYWKLNNIKLKGKVKNGKELKQPKTLKTFGWSVSKTSKNPFKCSGITDSHEYCEMCGYESSEWCQEHKYDDDNGDTRWRHNDELL